MAPRTVGAIPSLILPNTTGVCQPTRDRRCRGPDCPGNSFTEKHPLAVPRAETPGYGGELGDRRAAAFDTSVSALAHQLGISWDPPDTAGQCRTPHRQTGRSDRCETRCWGPDH
jgi:hypothetical protein